MGWGLSMWISLKEKKKKKKIWAYVLMYADMSMTMGLGGMRLANILTMYADESVYMGTHASIRSSKKIN